MNSKHILISFTILSFAFLANVQAQWGYGDPMAGFNQLVNEHQQWGMALQQYDQQMDVYVQQQMQMAQQQADQAYMNMQRFFIDYYRQQTGDYATPDAQDVMLGDQLYCQHNPAQCHQAIQQVNGWSQQSAAAHCGMC